MHLIDPQTVTTVPADLDDFHAAVMANMPVTTYLTYVGQGDRLPDDWADMLVRGDWASLDEDVWDACAEQRHDSAFDEVDDVADCVRSAFASACATVEEADWVDELHQDYRYSDQRQEAIDAAYDADQSDPLSDLAWGRAFVRVQLSSAVPWIEYGGCPVGAAVDDIMSSLTATVTGDLDAFRRDITNALSECVDGYHHLYLFGSIDLGELHAHDGATVTLGGGAILIEDIDAGAGSEVDRTDGYTITVPRDALRTDRDQDGYGWDETCGLVPGCYPLAVG